MAGMRIVVFSCVGLLFAADLVAGDQGPFTLDAKIISPEPQERDGFATSISVNNGFMFIGSPWHTDEDGKRIGCVFVFSRGADGKWLPMDKLSASDGEDNDRFGFSISVEQDVALIGAPWDDDNGENTGSAYIFHRSAEGSWHQEAKLTPASYKSNTTFGSSVSFSGGTAVIGAVSKSGAASKSDDQKGFVYIFAKGDDGSWSEAVECSPSSDGSHWSNEENSDFGRSVAIDGNLAIAGNPGECIRSTRTRIGGGENAGAVYVYAKEEGGEWSEQAKLTAYDAAENHDFGRALRLQGSRCIVTAARYPRIPTRVKTREEEKNKLSDCVYIFRRVADGSWEFESKLVSPASIDTLGGRKDGFAFDGLAIEDDILMIGASGSAGSVYVYEKSPSNRWSQIQKIEMGWDDSRGFGRQIVISDGVLFVTYEDRGSQARTVAIYSR